MPESLPPFLAELNIGSRRILVNLNDPIDISIPVRIDRSSVSAFHIPHATAQSFEAGNFVGDVKRGGSCNCTSIQINPHGNGTHTESIGHITPEAESVGECLKNSHFLALLVSIKPTELPSGDRVITRDQIVAALKGKSAPDALLIRTLPNSTAKLTANYSGTNPPYLHHEAALAIEQAGIKHLLVDLPSVDREDDGGKLLAHRAFWSYPSNSHVNRTITEFIFVPDSVADGEYLLNLVVPNLPLDAAPSRPLLYRII